MERNEVEKLKAQIQGLEQKMREMSEDTLGDFEEKAMDYGQELKNKYRQYGEKAKKMGEKAYNYAKENPLQVMAAGIVVGLIIGNLIRAKRCQCSEDY
jgi:ElaB/YqjD/DUF883 family membrane-anchored ribosome-binding protein